MRTDMTRLEECVEFRNAEGRLLRGILHRADPDAAGNITLIFLNTGLNDMVGWHRLQVKLARHLAGRGCNVLRFDNAGIGDSEGELEEGNVIDIFTRIETGLWARDAGCAVRFVSDRLKAGRTVLTGFCGGGLNAVIAAARTPDVAGVINVAAPIIVSNPKIAQEFERYHVRRRLSGYAGRLLSLRALYNFATGRSEYRRLFGTLWYSLLYGVGWRTPRMPATVARNEPGDSGATTSEGAPAGMNIPFLAAFEEYARTKRPILFYYADLDKATWDLKQYFLPRFQGTAAWHSGCEFIEVAEANHIFSGEDTQERMKRDLAAWLERLPGAR